MPAGGVSRPSPAAILNAGAALRNREVLRAITGGGDDRLLRAALTLVEEEGHRVLGVHEAAPDLLCPAGPIGRRVPDLAASALDPYRARRAGGTLPPTTSGRR